ncbi:DUF2975 domain-containing protein [Arthrobacter sp. NPDC055585]
MTKQEALPLRAALVAFACAALFVQFMLPLLAGGYAAAYPQIANLAVPYTVSAIAGIACFQVGLLAAWQILAAVVAEGAVTLGSTTWVNVLAFALGLTGLTLAGICAHAGSVVAVGGPAMLFGLFAGLALVPAAVALRNKFLKLGIDSGPDMRRPGYGM